jgi:uncharacterized protein GlcG (DUF336 family)
MIFLIVVHFSDNTILVSVTSVAEAKARAAILFETNSVGTNINISCVFISDFSVELGRNGLSLANGTSYHVELSNGGITSLDGGLLLRLNGQLIGAVGVRRVTNRCHTCHMLIFFLSRCLVIIPLPKILRQLNKELSGQIAPFRK